MDSPEVLKMIRNELGITQGELAKKIHVSFSTVNRWKNNKSTPNPIASVVLLDFFQKRKASSYLIEDFRMSINLKNIGLFIYTLNLYKTKHDAKFLTGKRRLI